MAKRLHTIKDNNTGCIVGYTVEGTFDNLLIFLDGFGYENFLHGETGNFKFYCVQFGWNYSLIEYRDTDLSVSKSIETNPDKMSFSEKVVACLFTIEAESQAFKNKHGMIMHEHHIQQALNELFKLYNIDHILQCFDIDTSSHFVGKGIVTEVEAILLIKPARPELLGMLTDIVKDTTNSVSYFSYHQSSSTGELNFTIAYS